MKILTLIALGLLAILTAPAQSTAERQEMTNLIRSDMSFAVQQYAVLIKNTPPGRLPRTFDAKKDEALTADSRWWCSGFYPGTLWYLYEYTGDPLLKKEATKKMALLEKEEFDTHDHDLGFKIYCSFGNAYRLTQDPACKEVILTAAKSLSARYRPSIQSIQSWDSSANWKCPVIIDNMMNLELLEWASRHGGDKSLGQIAVNHANTTLKNHIRPDYSSFHVVDYDLRTGSVLRKATWQGAAASSTWSRGEAWALYGYTMMYRFTKDKSYLSLAKHIAAFILDHPRLPQDDIPYWDFDAPGIPHAYRDVSAAAITASALLELAQYSSAAEKDKYIGSAGKILRVLSSDTYRARLGTNGGFLLKHSVGALPLNTEVDVPLAYADYYFIEALLRYRKWIIDPVAAAVTAAPASSAAQPDPSAFAASKAAAAIPAVTPSSPAPRRLVWSDEFNYTGLPDSTKWGYEEGFVRNKEPQYYTARRPENCRVENGMLVIEARKEDYPNPHYRQGSDQPAEAAYTSASLITLGRQTWQYGRIEVRAKVPAGPGAWPAIWMLGENRQQVKWPACGEIDILEFLGRDSSRVYGTVHYADSTNTYAHQGEKPSVGAPADGFHVYALEWYPDRLEFYYDSLKYFVFDIAKAQHGSENIFQKKFYLLLNLALGRQGSWAGPVYDKIFPCKYFVDYVRIYQ